MGAKGPDAFRTISEAAAEVGVPAHVLRFWETKFVALRPMRRPGARRFYRPVEVRLLIALRRLLHGQGESIADLQGLSRSALLSRAGEAGSVGDRLQAVLANAIAAKSRLDRLLH